MALQSNPIRTRNNFLFRKSFSITVRLDEPILGGKTNKVAYSLISACTLLQLQLEKQTLHKEENKEIVSRLSSQIHSLVKQLNRKSLHSMEYFEVSGLSTTFPLVHSQLFSKQIENEYSEVSEYLNHIGVLHQLIQMSEQLRYDCANLPNQKYIAHQIALLYQCLNHAGDGGISFRKRIEQKFNEIKALTEAEKSPQLTKDHKEWLHKLTTDIINEVSTFQEFNNKLESIKTLAKIVGQ